MKKTIYEVPSTRILQVKVQGMIMNSVLGSPAPANISNSNIIGGEEGEEW